MCWKNRRKKNKTFVWLILSTSFRLSSVGCWSCISIWIIYIRHTSLILSWWNVYCCDILLLWNKDRSPSFHFSYIFIFCCRCCYALMCLFRCCRPRVVYSLSRNRSENNPSSLSTMRTHNQHDKSKLEAITSIGAANWNPYRVECVGEKYETRKKNLHAFDWDDNLSRVILMRTPSKWKLERKRQEQHTHKKSTRSAICANAIEFFIISVVW